MPQVMFITYDLEQEQNPNQKSSILRGAKEVALSGRLIGWKVGEFEVQSGRKMPGVQLTLNTGIQVIEIPANAQNVQVHTGSLPREYQSALKSAA